MKRNPCAWYGGSDSPESPRPHWEQVVPQCASTITPAELYDPVVTADGRSAVPTHVRLPMLVAAIDPVEEAKLVGLDSAVTAGRYLTASDRWAPGVAPSLPPSVDDPWTGPGIPPHAPALLATGLDADYSLRTTAELLPDATTQAFLTAPPTYQPEDLIGQAPAERGLGTTTFAAADLYASFLTRFPPGRPLTADVRGWDGRAWFTEVLRPGEVTYAPGTPLRPVPVTPNASLTDPERLTPRTAEDTGFRETPASAGGPGIAWHSGCQDPSACWSGVMLDVVGHFDPTLVRQGGSLGAVPLETYTAAKLLPADQASRDALGADTCRPDLNPAGYNQLPPSLLIPLDALPMLRATELKVVETEAPVSAVRVRVAGVTGLDAASRERIRLVAERIQQATGLDVDITVGSSQVKQRVELPRTLLGVPALNLDELWSKKGVAVTILTALDHKSLLLFGLILVSSGLTVAVSAHAAVQARRRELGTLACLGWRAGQLRREVLVELGLIGAVAGVVGAGASWPLAQALAVAFERLRALWAIPIAVGLTLIAGLSATVSAGRITPIDAVRAAVVAPRAAPRPVTTAVGFGVRQLLLRPSRLAVGALAVALGTASLTLLGSIVWAFQGAVVGSFLGDAVALQVRGADVIAAAFLAVLGLVAVATILFLGLTEDARTYAALQAVGWRDARLGLGLAAQAALIGIVGGLVGAASGLGLVTWLIGIVDPRVIGVAALVATGAVVAAVVVALVPGRVAPTPADGPPAGRRLMRRPTGPRDGVPATAVTTRG